MATPYTGPQQSTLVDSHPVASQWQEPRTNPAESSNYRSVTPAMNNTRGGVRTASPAPVRGPSPGAAAKAAGGSAIGAHYGNRSGTPSRYDSFQTPEPGMANNSSPNPSSTVPNQSGLIRLSLRKPMGIVFEPMYDPNAPSVQRGVRICDLPRTGAAALSRKLEVGDELLSINDKTMSRLTFDEIMDFIIEADPEEVNLLFRRPKKETLKERAGIKTPSNAASTGPGVKWVDDESRKRKDGKKKDPKAKDKKGNRRPKYRDDDETLQSEDVDYRNRRKKGRKKDPYETESFLDILIDTICANPDSVCRDRRGRGDDEDYSDDDETFASRDDSTYVTYESEEQRKSKAKSKAKVKGQNRDDDDDSTYGETEEDTLDDKQRKVRDKDSNRSSPPKEAKRSATPEKPKKYDDDNTLETLDSAERAKQMHLAEHDAPIPPLGLAPNPEPNPVGVNIPEETDDDGNPAPIKEVEYDDQVDHGADVSVMESLGGPSLLIEKQRQAQIMAQKSSAPTPPVSAEIMDAFGKDYPLDFGFSREQTIQNDPLRFYTFVVKGLLQEHEPEKVRLLDKLLAKYKGREDHLVQKLSVRYNKEDDEDGDFEEAVRKEKDSAHVRHNVETAKERIQNDFNPTEWPEKETKEADPEDDHGEEESGSEYSGDSIDGTSPAVIAQVSELLNYVYGKTSVPGQIDRVSTIMRAYEGREAVLLELLETKALIKANREKENAGNLPSFLRNSANAQRMGGELEVGGDMPPVTPMAAQPPITDDISSMSGVSTPADIAQQVSAGVLKQISGHESGPSSMPASMDIKGLEAHHHLATTPKSKPPPTPDRSDAKKKKKGLFGGLFGKKGKKGKDDKSATERTSSRTRGLRSPMARKTKNGDASI